ncbi:MAG: hypothetical protein ACH349_02125 [Candidatus Rhabdochlamydia sp.]|jgi:hypothetical protein|nr:hypothetical protein [Chlamydiota bacterium]
MTHCIRTRLPEICYAPIGQNGVNYNANGHIIFLDHRLKELAPNSYEFLYLHGKKIIDITQKGFSTENENQIQKNAIKQVAADLAVFAVNCYSMNYLPASLASLPIWFLACKLTNCANERIKAKEVDASLVKDPLIPPEVLKGGLLFYKAWQEVNKTKNRIFFTNYGESRFSVLESTPALEERITQIEEELKRRGINIEVDQKTTEKIEKLFYSSI